MTEKFNQENTNPNLQIEENSTYPLVNNITYKERVNNQRKSNKQTVHCKINYVDGIPQFCIEYGFNFQNVIFSTKSSSDAALNYERATISGPLVFGLQLNSVQKAREARRRGHLIKPANNCVQSILKKHAKKIAERTQVSFNNNVKEIYHEFDKVVLKEIEFSLNDMDFQVNY
ncbi:13045_t:CDS:2, partial [Entrophospora sp. SA101]